MAKKAYIGVDGAAKKVKKAYFGIDGIAKKVKKAYIGVDGVAKLCFNNAPSPIYYFNNGSFDESTGGWSQGSSWGSSIFGSGDAGASVDGNTLHLWIKDLEEYDKGVMIATNNPVDLSPYSRIDIVGFRNDGLPASRFRIAVGTSRNHSSEVKSTILDIGSLDVSDLNGEYYIHLTLDSADIGASNAYFRASSIIGYE